MGFLRGTTSFRVWTCRSASRGVGAFNEGGAARHDEDEAGDEPDDAESTDSEGDVTPAESQGPLEAWTVLDTRAL